MTAQGGLASARPSLVTAALLPSIHVRPAWVAAGFDLTVALDLKAATSPAPIPGEGKLQAGGSRYPIKVLPGFLIALLVMLI